MARPPSFDTAATSSGVDGPPAIGARMMGYRTPTRAVSAVSGQRGRVTVGRWPARERAEQARVRRHATDLAHRLGGAVVAAHMVEFHEELIPPRIARRPRREMADI